MNAPLPAVNRVTFRSCRTRCWRCWTRSRGRCSWTPRVGAGGHARLVAERLGPAGRLIGLDRDASMLALAAPRLAGPRRRRWSTPASTSCPMCSAGSASTAVDGVLADLGVCSDQLDAAERGFSFGQPAPLDMRLDPTAGETAADLLRRLSERDLADLFWQYGEERFSRRIARRIVETRRLQPLKTTDQLAELVRRCVPRPPRKGGRRRPPIDPATRVFQALRIAVNDELGALDRLLAALPDCLRSGRAGRAHQLPFAGGPARQTGLPRPHAVAGIDAQAGPGRRRGSRPQPTGAAPSCVRPF